MKVFVRTGLMTMLGTATYQCCHCSRVNDTSAVCWWKWYFKKQSVDVETCVVKENFARTRGRSRPVSLRYGFVKRLLQCQCQRRRYSQKRTILMSDDRTLTETSLLKNVDVLLRVEQKAVRPDKVKNNDTGKCKQRKHGQKPRRTRKNKQNKIWTSSYRPLGPSQKCTT